MKVIEILDEKIYDANKNTQNIQVNFKKFVKYYSLKLIKLYYYINVTN